ncbi:glycosyl-phosphatidylinositol-anchored molecule-like protein [Apodemus sylvaticus]|uniref:glycosyl-phosphatidylinositol-anchored molecule-like protein n=1 Tax=Apodemus sylvaticus TaxID=10129 RepID=UPI0022449B50|nr:glycosyl-phosphatidylinositol-anchored molecule-like protein [Apodemus sylvaticus]
MMLPFVLLILLGLPWVDTTVSNTSVLDNSTSGLDDALEARQWIPRQRCSRCSVVNTFACTNVLTCPLSTRRCMTIAVRVSLRNLFVYKDCTVDCSFVYKEHVPPPLPRLLKDVKSFYFVLCCGGVHCNEGGPTNMERDLLTDTTIEEEEIARAVRLGRFNLLLCLALILSSSILT